MSAPQRLPANYIATQVDDELVVLGLQNGELYSLKGVARTIWDALDGKRDVPTIARHLAEGFAHDAHLIEHDVSAFVADLAAAKLVTAASKAQTP